MRSSDRLGRLLELLGEGSRHAQSSDPDHAALLDGVLALAAEQRVLPAVGAALIRRGADPVPAELARFLSQQREPLGARDRALVAVAMNHLRNVDLLEQLVRARELFAQRGITMIPLKGAAILEEDPGAARELTDLDLLVCDEARLEDARDALIGEGYRDVSLDEYDPDPMLLHDEHQLRPLVRPGRQGSIELHRSVLQTEYDALLSKSDLASDAGIGRHGLRVSPSGLALHSILHNRVVDNSYRRLDPGLRSVLDVLWCLRRDPAVAQRLEDHARTEAGLVARSIRATMLVVRVLTPDLGLPAPGLRARCWWWRVRLVDRAPRVRALLGALSFVAFALRRERMEARAGRRLGAGALLVARARFLVWRSVRFARKGE